ncbi:alpha/beta hydrolase [Priestia megaterium]|uniref:poly(ethylene terephthalate) hydrolase family protein n=1 Tax=Priestia TaxID=2800373 RepID=UPI0025A36B40|nr:MULTISPECIES: alpha/beta hydrolase [Priestia]MED5121758.1 alpha/beta hydrolase [Priestia megaterium]WJN47620.1 alpha/beta hydrolase [Priestia aryabhattai]
MKKIMITLLKIILIIFVVILLGIFAFIKIAEHREANYSKYTETAGEIEKKYTELGDKEVAYKEYDANDDVIGKYAIWFPSELESKENKYPVVIFANGTGSTSSTYKPFLEHLSSWGFISVGNDDKDTRTGASLEETIKFLIKENENKDSVFYQKIDLDNIGIGGHSQGGAAVFNMVANQEHGYMIKALYAASATSSYHTMVMGDQWEYDISKVNIPVFLTAGTGYWDAGNATSKEQATDDENGVVQGICPLWSLQENYNLLPETMDKVVARKKNTDHGDSYKQFDGYMTAWFMYYLQNDKEAKEIFTVGGELSTNNLYQDVQTNIK